MIIRKEKTKAREMKNISITNYITSEFSENFSIALAQLSGRHSRTMNKVSDRAYFILDGSATVEVGEEVTKVSAYDAIFIAKGTPHAIEGQATYIVINSPPFDPKNEQPLE